MKTDRGPWVQALLAAGYTVYAINPLQAARYRERYGVSGAKSDPGDAHVLAELVRLDRAHHRPIAGDSAVAEHVKVVARAHQSMVWSRQRQTNTLRSMLREYYPAALEAFGEDLAGRDALAVLAIAPAPAEGRRLRVARVEKALRAAARVLAEFGDDPDRYGDARARKNYSGMAPVTRASGKTRVVLARHARNRRLADALYQQAFAALRASPGARAFYDAHRARGNTHHQALRALANRLVGVLHGCLRHRRPYDEATAWPPQINPAHEAAA